MSVGSQAPEQVFAGVRALQSQGNDSLSIIATSPHGRNNDRRARKLGVELVYGWPEGAFHQVVKLTSAAPAVVKRRFSERAPVGRKLALGDELGVDARIVNISTSGAMLDCDAVGAKIESIGFDFAGGGAAQAVVFARVVWREEHGSRMRLGLQFVDVSDGTRAAIDRFVRETNVVRVGGARPPAPEPLTGRTVRVIRQTRRDYFQLEDNHGALVLVPKAPFFVPYQIGDDIEIVPLDGKRSMKGRIIGRRAVDPDRIDSVICWDVQPTAVPSAATIDASGAALSAMLDASVTTLTSLDANRLVAEPAGEGGIVVTRPRDPRWIALAELVDALVAEDAFAGCTHVIVMPPATGATVEFSARTFMMALDGSGTTLLFRETDLVMRLPPAPVKPLVLGRSSSSDICVDNDTVSKVHARLTWLPASSSWSLEDLGSSNGTRFREDAFAEHEEELRPGVARAVRSTNVLRLGKQRLHVVSIAELRASCRELLAKRLLRRRS